MAQPRIVDQAHAATTDEEAKTSCRSRFINPHRLFHGVWPPQWLEERPEVSDKAKKLYAYLTYFAGGKGCSWPSFDLPPELENKPRRTTSPVTSCRIARRAQKTATVSRRRSCIEFCL